MTRLEISKLPEEIRRNLNAVLEDDNTPTGGTSFQGETLKDFLFDVVMPAPEVLTMADVNRLLESCGIRPITVQKDHAWVSSEDTLDLEIRKN